MTQQFEPGDRVIMKETYYSKIIGGLRGTVVLVENNGVDVGVEWDEDINGHSFEGDGVDCREGHGWFVSYKSLKKIATITNWRDKLS